MLELRELYCSVLQALSLNYDLGFESNVIHKDSQTTRSGML